MPWEVDITVEGKTYPVRFDKAEKPTDLEIAEAAQTIGDPARGQSTLEGMGASAEQGLQKGLTATFVSGPGAVAEAFGAEDNAMLQEGRRMEADIEADSPISRENQQRFPVKAAGAIGQAASMVATAPLAGAGTGFRAATMFGKARQIALMGGLAGASAGEEEAERLGITNPLAKASVILGTGALEFTSELAGGFTTETALPRAVAGLFGRRKAPNLPGIVSGFLTEAGEEIGAGVTQRGLSKAFATEDPQNPGFTVEGQPIYDAWDAATILEEGTLGGIAGGVMVGAANVFNRLSPQQQADAKNLKGLPQQLAAAGWETANKINSDQSMAQPIADALGEDTGGPMRVMFDGRRTENFADKQAQAAGEFSEGWQLREKANLAHTGEDADTFFQDGQWMVAAGMDAQGQPVFAPAPNATELEAARKEWIKTGEMPEGMQPLAPQVTGVGPGFQPLDDGTFSAEFPSQRAAEEWTQKNTASLSMHRIISTGGKTLVTIRPKQSSAQNSTAPVQPASAPATNEPPASAEAPANAQPKTVAAAIFFAGRHLTGEKSSGVKASVKLSDGSVHDVNPVGGTTSYPELMLMDGNMVDANAVSEVIDKDLGAVLWSKSPEKTEASAQIVPHGSAEQEAARLASAYPNSPELAQRVAEAESPAAVQVLLTENEPKAQLVEELSTLAPIELADRMREAGADEVEVAELTEGNLDFKGAAEVISEAKEPIPAGSVEVSRKPYEMEDGTTGISIEYRRPDGRTFMVNTDDLKGAAEAEEALQASDAGIPATTRTQPDQFEAVAREIIKGKRGITNANVEAMVAHHQDPTVALPKKLRALVKEVETAMQTPAEASTEARVERDQVTAKVREVAERAREIDKIERSLDASSRAPGITAQQLAEEVRGHLRRTGIQIEDIADALGYPPTAIDIANNLMLDAKKGARAKRLNEEIEREETPLPDEVSAEGIGERALTTKEKQAKRGQGAEEAPVGTRPQDTSDALEWADRILREGHVGLFDIETMAAHAVRAADWIKTNGPNYAKWAKEQISRFGQGIRDYLRRIWDSARALLIADKALPEVLTGEAEPARLSSDADDYTEIERTDSPGVPPPAAERRRDAVQRLLDRTAEAQGAKVELHRNDDQPDLSVRSNAAGELTVAVHEDYADVLTRLTPTRKAEMVAKFRATIARQAAYHTVLADPSVDVPAAFGSGATIQQQIARAIYDTLRQGYNESAEVKGLWTAALEVARERPYDNERQRAYDLGQLTWELGRDPQVAVEWVNHLLRLASERQSGKLAEDRGGVFMGNKLWRDRVHRVLDRFNARAREGGYGKTLQRLLDEAETNLGQSAVEAARAEVEAALLERQIRREAQQEIHPLGPFDVMQRARANPYREGVAQGAEAIQREMRESGDRSIRFVRNALGARHLPEIVNGAPFAIESTGVKVIVTDQVYVTLNDRRAAQKNDTSAAMQALRRVMAQAENAANDVRQDNRKKLARAMVGDVIADMQATADWPVFVNDLWDHYRLQLEQMVRTSTTEQRGVNAGAMGLSFFYNDEVQAVRVRDRNQAAAAWLTENFGPQIAQVIAGEQGIALNMTPGFDAPTTGFFAPGIDRDGREALFAKNTERFVKTALAPYLRNTAIRFSVTSGNAAPNRIEVSQTIPKSKSELVERMKSLGVAVDDEGGYSMHLDAPSGYVWSANNEVGYSIHYASNVQTWWKDALKAEWDAIKMGMDRVTDPKRIEEIRWNNDDPNWGASEIPDIKFSVQRPKVIATGVKAKDVDAAKEGLAKLLPNVATAWSGTRAELSDYLRKNEKFKRSWVNEWLYAEDENGVTRASQGKTMEDAAESYENFITDGLNNVEGFTRDFRTYLINDQIAVTEEDGNELMAVRRVLIHENAHDVVEYMRDISPKVNAAWEGYRDEVSDNELDELAGSLYPWLSGWRDNKATKDKIFHEWIAKKTAEIEWRGMPAADSLFGRILNWWRSVVRKLMGTELAPSDQALLDFMDAGREAMFRSMGEMRGRGLRFSSANADGDIPPRRVIETSAADFTAPPKPMPTNLLKPEWQERREEAYKVAPKEIKDWGQYLGRTTDNPKIIQTIAPMIDSARAWLGGINGEKPELNDENTEKWWQTVKSFLKRKTFAKTYIKHFQTVFAAQSGGELMHAGDAAAGALWLEAMDYAVRVAGLTGDTKPFRTMMPYVNDVILGDYLTASKMGRGLNIRSHAVREGGFVESLRLTTMAMYESAVSLVGKEAADGLAASVETAKNGELKDLVEDGAVEAMEKTVAGQEIVDAVGEVTEEYESEGYYQRVLESGILDSEEQALAAEYDAHMKRLDELIQLQKSMQAKAGSQIKPSMSEDFAAYEGKPEDLQKAIDAERAKIKEILAKLNRNDTSGISKETRRKRTKPGIDSNGKKVRAEAYKALMADEQAKKMLERYMERNKRVVRERKPWRKTFDEQVRDPKTKKDFIEAITQQQISPETAEALFERAEELSKDREAAMMQRTAEKDVTGEKKKAVRVSFLRSVVQKITAAPIEKQSDAMWKQQTIVDAFIAKGMNPKQAEAMAKKLTHLIDGVIRKGQEIAGVKALKALGRTKGVNLDRFREAIRTGAVDPLNPNPAIRALAEQAGFKGLTPAQFQRLAQLDPIIASALPHLQAKAITEMEDILYRVKPTKDWQEHLAQYLRDNALAGLSVTALNAVHQVYVVGRRVITEMVTTAVFTGKEGRLAFGNQIEMLARAFEGFMKEAQFTFTNDAYTHKMIEMLNVTNRRINEFRDARDIWQGKAPGNKGKALLLMVYHGTDIVRRTLATCDQVWGSVLQGYVMQNESFRTLIERGGMTKEQAAMQLDAAHNAGDAMYQRSLSAGLSELDAAMNRKDAVLEALSQRVDRAVFDATGEQGVGKRAGQTAAQEFQIELGNRMPETAPFPDFANWIFEGLKAMAHAAKNINKPFGLLAVGFVSVPANIVDRSLYFTPWGIARAWYKLKKGDATTHYGETMKTHGQARMRMIEGIAGTFGILLLAALRADKDDEDGIVITGSGPKNKSVNEAWQKFNKPFHVGVRINGKMVFGVSYTRGGLDHMSLALTTLGAWDDVELNGHKPTAQDTKFALKYGAESWQNMAHLGAVYGSTLWGDVWKQARFFGTKNLYSSLPSSTSEASLLSSTGYLASPFIPLSGMVKSMTRLFSGQLDRTSMDSALLVQLPFAYPIYRATGGEAKPALNLLGDPIYAHPKGAVSNFMVRLENEGFPFLAADITPENEDIYSFILKKGAAPSAPARGDLEAKNGFLPDPVWRTYLETRGAIIKDTIRRRMSSLERMKAADLESEMSDISRKSTLSAKRKLSLD